LSLRAVCPKAGAATVNGRVTEEARMQWTAPKIVEIACGCEINAYFPADL
jgi:coenzyme PQQ precursor peptide PqqA